MIFLISFIITILFTVGILLTAGDKDRIEDFRKETHSPR